MFETDDPPGYTILVDLTFSFLPIVILRNVQIAFHHKVAVSGLMSLGLMQVRFRSHTRKRLTFDSATACAAVRAYVTPHNMSSPDLSCEYEAWIYSSFVICL